MASTTVPANVKGKRMARLKTLDPTPPPTSRWLCHYPSDLRPTLMSFLMGTHENIGQDSPLRLIPREIVRLIFSFLRVEYPCAVCGDEAVFCCSNMPDARKTYTEGCIFFSCASHSNHTSDDCLKVGRFCGSCSHNCSNNHPYCGKIKEHGIPFQTDYYWQRAVERIGPEHSQQLVERKQTWKRKQNYNTDVSS